MGGKTTQSIYISTDLVEEIKRRNINLSQLCERLIREFLYGSNNFSEDHLKIKELQREFEIFRKKIEEFERQLNELSSKAEEEVKIQEAEEDNHILTVIKEHPVLSKSYWDLERDARRLGNTVEGLINVNLEAIARNHKISLKKAQELFFKAFPELKDKIKL